MSEPRAKSATQRIRNVAPRRRSAIAALYQFDAGGAKDLDSVRTGLEELELFEADARDAELAEKEALASDELVTETSTRRVLDPEAALHRSEAIEAGLALASLAWEFRKEADADIARYAKDWPVHRQPMLDRAIMRLAWYELMHGEGRTPAAAGETSTTEGATQQGNAARVINEAVELAKRFSTEKSGGFVNAILDRIHNARLPKPASEAT
ncbi:MAG: transcription antitermination protein NusB [Phycisphaerales bacterium]|nr:transcription antitermination protein NusB [Phycisphaerales bacterium]